jgi:hypothetical protein
VNVSSTGLQRANQANWSLPPRPSVLCAGAIEGAEATYQLMLARPRSVHRASCACRGSATPNISAESACQSCTPDVDTLLVAVGGGGLIAGIAAWFGSKLKVVGVEPEASPRRQSRLPPPSVACGLDSSSRARRRPPWVPPNGHRRRPRGHEGVVPVSRRKIEVKRLRSVNPIFT